MRAKRLLLAGDSLTGAEAAEWGLATEAAPGAELDARFGGIARHTEEGHGFVRLATEPDR